MLVRPQPLAPLLLAAGLALAFAAAGSAQGGSLGLGGGPIVEGRVTDPGGNPIVGARVDAHLRSEFRADYAVTDLQGGYRLVLPRTSEHWELRVSADGYFPQQTSVGVWRSRHRYDFVLRPDPNFDPTRPARDARERRRARAEMRDGLRAAEKGDRARAIERLERAVELDPTYGPALNNLGVQLRLAGREEEAERRFRQVIELEPLDYHARFNLGSLLSDTGRFAEAVPELETAALVDPASYPAAYALGRAFVAVGDARALVALRDAERVAPAGSDLTLEISDALVVAGRFDEALAAKKTWLTSHASDPRADHVRATIAQLEARSE